VLRGILNKKAQYSDGLSCFGTSIAGQFDVAAPEDGRTPTEWSRLIRAAGFHLSERAAVAGDSIRLA
jgi:hypothetical protein